MPGNKFTPSSYSLPIPFLGGTRYANLHPPQGIGTKSFINAPSLLRPMILCFHGNGSTGAAMELFTQMDLTADAYGFFVLYLQGATTSWITTGSPSDIDVVNQVLKYVTEGWPIDTTRMYLAGYSEGAGMATQMHVQNPGKFAGLSMSSENLGLGTTQSNLSALPTPVLLFHGTADPVSPYTGSGGLNSTLSTPVTASLWAQNNGCANALTPIVSSFPGLLSNGTATFDTLSDYGLGTNGYPTLLYSITGGGHTWPGGTQSGPNLGPVSQTVNASLLTWLILSPFSI